MSERLVEAEEVVRLSCEGDSLPAIHHPSGSSDSDWVVVNVVGGPQYRVGSHRQFVITSRTLAERSIPSLRFDCRGMGDAEGTWQTFEDITDDIHAAVSWMRNRYPGARIALMGLCDGASAAAMYSSVHPVEGLVLLNPWVHSESGSAAVTLRHYYFKRLLSASFWRKVATLEIDLRGSSRDLGDSILKAKSRSSSVGFVEKMKGSLTAFSGGVLLIMSGDDLIAREFDALLTANEEWRRLTLRNAWTRVDIGTADHTFSDRIDLDAQTSAIVEWLASKQSDSMS